MGRSGGNPKKICPEAGCFRLIKRRSRYCRAHSDARRGYPERHVCPDCGGRKSTLIAATCRPCYQDGRADLVRHFSAEWFRELLRRPGTRWTFEELSEATGGQVPVSTLEKWASGARPPRKSSWQYVARVLGLEGCPHCGGSGTWDPTEGEGAQPPAPLVARARAKIRRDGKRGNITVDRSETPRTRFRDGTWFDPDLKAFITGDGTEVPLTPLEVGVLVVTLQLCRNRWASLGEVAERLEADQHSVRVCATRLRRKCEQYGIDWRAFWNSGVGRGWKLDVIDIDLREGAA